jgi:hypothetical protein
MTAAADSAVSHADDRHLGTYSGPAFSPGVSAAGAAVGAARRGARLGPQPSRSLTMGIVCVTPWPRG